MVILGKKFQLNRTMRKLLVIILLATHSIGRTFDLNFVGGPDFLAPRLWERSTASSSSSGPGRSESDGKGGVFLSFGTVDWMDGEQVGAPIKLRESDGSIDPTFKRGIQGFHVVATAVAPDGKVLIAQFRDNCGSVERLLPNGRRDETFTPIAFSQGIRYLTLAPNGDILVTVFGNFFSTPHPKAVLTPTPTVVRLKPNGVLDTSFAAPTIEGANRFLFAPPVIDALGRIYIGGSFTIGTTDKRVNIARLLPNGALDLTFLGSASLTSPMTGTIRGIAFQKDGKVVAVGDIRLPERVTAMRFDVEGRRDLSFTSVLRTAIGASDYPRMAVIQPDDKIVCAAGGLVRLNADGTLDATFKRFVIPGGFLSWVSSLADGRLLVPGVVSEGPNAFLADGTPDPSFKTHHFGVTQIPTSLALLPSERSVIAGGFNRMNSQPRTGLAILDNMGRPDAVQPDLSGLYPGFTEHTFYDSSFGSQFVAEADDGAFYFAGNLFNTNREPVFESIARLNGPTRDTTFQPALAEVSSGNRIVSATDGGLWVVHHGAQAALDGKWLTRLLASGQRAPTFSGLPASVLAELGEVTRLPDRSISQIKAGYLRILRSLPDGGLLAALNAINGTARVIRLDSAGQLVGSFQAPQVVGLAGTVTFSDIIDQPIGAAQVQGLSFQEPVFSGAAVLPDGRWAICGNFSELSGKQSSGVALLQSNGNLDASFVPPSATYDIHPFTTARMLSVETDTQGRIYLAGLFDKLAGEPVPGLVRLHPSGAWDRSFVSPVELTDYPIASAELRIQGDNLFALGTFRDPSELFPRPLWRISLASDDMELAARVDENGRIYLVLAITSGRPLTNADSAAIGFEFSTDLRVWNSAPGAVTLENGILRFEPSPGGGEASRFYRSLRRASDSSVPTQLGLRRQPAGSTSGGALSSQPVVELRDAQGNPVGVGSSVSVTVTIGSGIGGSLGGTTTVTAVNGVATFANLTLSGTVGVNYVLRFSATGLTSVESAPVTVRLAQPVISDPQGNLSGDSTRAFMDIIATTIRSEGSNLVLDVQMAAPFPTAVQMAGGKRFDVIWFVDVDRNLATGQTASGNDYNIHLYLDETGWHHYWFKVSSVSQADRIVNSPSAFKIASSGDRATLTFPQSYLPSHSFEMWATCFSANAPTWTPVTQNPATSRAVFNF